ncbi:MAG: hypothetical protein KF853_11050 [Rhodocyclaceae bacterium]|jgi:hypothetical protein|nr:hypothetical protein [Rhodocyclaceae bacterium]MCP5296479.1 hypothetical protein [Zoogloeaceae bacterium]MCW5596107.1 hypothetical protein [Rhodocyclaceae bacterium]MCZ7655081.1 hypothetical protein [Rhodocyclaceae bacterium]PKO70949.1 MAG: hypothetical protein CVU20_09055 [Betaproteobacteria bacterium HGW-Betaproteobacteria-14]
MGMLVNVVVADPEDAGAIIESPKPIEEEWKGFESRGLDQAKFAMLHALLTGELFDEAMSDCGPVYAASEEGPWLMKLPDETVQQLARLDEDALDRVGEELAATEEFEADGWPSDAVMGFVNDLADLAGVARAQGRAMFVWMAADA